MLKVHNINLSLGGLKILNDLSFEIEEGKITGLIGPNGAGKSTVFNVVTGLISFATGSVQLRKQDILGAPSYQVSRMGIMRTFQDAQVLPQISVLENLISASPLIRDASLFQVFFRPKMMERMKAEAAEKARELLKKVGIEEKSNVLAQDLSYGQSKLVEILKVFMSDAELVFLDEPFSGLYPEMIKVIKGLVYELIESGRTVVLVEHNMKLIEEVCDHVVVLDFGTKLAEGKFEEVRENKDVVNAYLGH
ncbi:MAG: ABC transporter ATP-binding protein [Candidatus Gracilibacteria bacterium]|nr:ABC transporter ATP-binding protein [Candidatus Gracilibacteria bacterium]